jgi:lysophospholipase L1-like esterase
MNPAAPASLDDGAHALPIRTRRWRAAFVVAVLLLGVSLVGNLLLVRAAFEYFKTNSAVRLDPLGLKVYASERAHPPAGHPLLVFFGDSRALMWGRPAAAGYAVVNRGIGFQTTAQVLARVDRDVVDLHPDVVVLEAGVNDLKAIADFPERRAEIVADCEANIRRIVDACRHAGATVVLTSVFELGDVSLWKRPFWSNDVAAAVNEVNAYLPTLASDGVLVYDANVALDDGHGHVRRPYQFDYLHLSPEGYAALTPGLLSLLATRRAH